MAKTEGVGRAENSLQLTSLDIFLEISKIQAVWSLNWEILQVDT